MKIVYDQCQGPVTKSMADIPVDTVFSARGYPCLLRYYQGVVSLSAPGHNWTLVNNKDMVFYEYVELEVEIVIKGDKRP